MLVLVITGKIGAGKDTASNYLCERHGFVPVSYSEIVHEKTAGLGLETSRANLQKVATECRQKHGMDYFARLVVERARSTGAEYIVLKEARVKEDLKPAMAAFGKGLHVVEITAPQTVRFSRLRERGGPKDAKEWKDFIEQERREEALGYFGAAELAESRVSNAGTQEELHKSLGRLVERLAPAKSHSH